MKRSTASSDLTRRPPRWQRPPSPGSARPHFRGGFTLIELLVVIAIVVLVTGIAVPLFGALSGAVRAGGAVNTVHVSVAAARAYATRDLNGPFTLVGGRYSGTAVIFTPANEIRLVENIPFARNGSGNYLEAGGRNGYADIEGRDYIKLSRDNAVAGIARNTPGDAILLTPPFAIRFDQRGALLSGQPSSADKVVYYDGDRDGAFEVSIGRTSAPPYNPDDWNPDQRYNNQPVPADAEGRYHLPFEEIESVVGVIVYSDKDFRAANIGAGALEANDVADGDPLNTPAAEWILDNGTPVFFSRYSGAAVSKR